MLLTEILDEVPDPRGYNAVHDLTDVLFVALAAVLCGAVHCTEMAFFAKTRLELLRQFVPLGRGAPSHDTFTRVLGALDPQAFQTAFGRFMAAFGEQARADTRGQVAVDGKPLVVTAFDCETFMSLSQVVAQAGGEARAAIAALELLSLKGCIVSGDALHCHRRMTKAVRDGGGHYVLAIKGNQATLAKQASAALDKAQASARTPIGETEDRAHGRHEVRRAIVIAFAQAPARKALVDLKAVASKRSPASRAGAHSKARPLTTSETMRSPSA